MSGCASAARRIPAGLTVVAARDQGGTGPRTTRDRGRHETADGAAPAHGTAPAHGAAPADGTGLGRHGTGGRTAQYGSEILRDVGFLVLAGIVLFKPRTRFSVDGLLMGEQ